MVAPAQHIRRSSPPVYRTVHEKAVVSPEHVTYEWRVIDGKRVYCKVVIPARYGTKARQVVVKPGQNWLETIPARYETRLETVLVEPARHVNQVIPAVTRTISEKIVVSQEHAITRTIPAEYTTEYRQVKVREGGQGWRRINPHGSC